MNGKSASEPKTKTFFQKSVTGVAILGRICKIIARILNRQLMNELQTEIAELKSFIADLKADRAATKEKEKREAWTKYVSLSIVIIAVIAAIAAQWGGKI